MKITQISVFLENKKGRLLDVTVLLGKNKINIRALTIAESKEFGVIRLVVDRPQAAVRALKAGGFVAEMTDIVAIEVEDRPGGLAGILKVLFEAGINIEYMYGFVEKFTERALLVMRFSDPDKAIAVLKKAKVKIINKKDIETL